MDPQYQQQQWMNQQPPPVQYTSAPPASADEIRTPVFVPPRPRGRPKKQKVPKPPPRPRGRPKIVKPASSSQDHMAPAALDCVLTHIKGIKEVAENVKKTLINSGSCLPSLLKESDSVPKFRDLCDAYDREKEYLVKAQNANQDFHGTFRVYLRVKPPMAGESVVKFTPEKDPCLVTAPSSGASKKFEKLNGVFANHETQAQVFEKLQPLVRRVVEGSNMCFLAYGQSGSGKTYSLFGPSHKGILTDNHGKSPGLCQLAIGEIMNLGAGSWNFEFSMQEVMEKGKTAYLSDPAIVQDFDDAIRRLQKGFKLRACGATNLNQQSSRSHCIVKLELQSKDANDETICGGRLYMVDLAGSEKVKQSKVQGSDLKKTSKINTSLLELERVMQSLSEKAVHVPFRNDVLTLQLRDCLEGTSKVVVLAHVSPLEEFYNETAATLDFAETTARVRNGVLESLDREVVRLKKRIKNHTTSLQSSKKRKLI